MVRLSDPVIYVDPEGTARGAVLCTIWAERDKDAAHGTVRDPHGNVTKTDDPAPTVNLAFTSGDPDRRDNAGYGRQLERASSCVHMTRQTTPGNYWRRADEAGKETER